MCESFVVASAALRCSGIMVEEVRFPSDISKRQWAVIRGVLADPSKQGPKHGRDLRKVVDALLYITHTGCQWRYLPTDFGDWTRVWGQFQRWSLNGTLTRLLAAVHEQARIDAGRTRALLSMVIIDTHLARGASHGGAKFHDRGGPYGMTKGAKRAIAVDITGRPLCARVVPASTTESGVTGILLQDLHDNKQTGRLTLVLVDRGTSKRKADALTKQYGLEVRRVFWETKPVDPRTGERIFKPLPHVWRVEVPTVSSDVRAGSPRASRTQGTRRPHGFTPPASP